MNTRSPLNYAAASSAGMPIIAGGQAAADVALPAAAPAVPMAAAAAPVAGAAAPAATTQGGSSLVSGLPDIIHTWSSYFEALAFICFALALLWLLLWLVKKRGTGFMGGGSVPTMRVESRMPIGPKKWIVVTRYLDRRLVLGVTEQQITLLSEITLTEGGDTAPPSKNAASAFASLLKGKKEEAPSD